MRLAECNDDEEPDTSDVDGLRQVAKATSPRNSSKLPITVTVTAPSLSLSLSLSM
jgi:hypothetical protein